MNAGCCVAARGTTVRGTCVPRIATGTPPEIGTTMSVSELPVRPAAGICALTGAQSAPGPSRAGHDERTGSARESVQGGARSGSMWPTGAVILARISRRVPFRGAGCRVSWRAPSNASASRSSKASTSTGALACPDYRGTGGIGDVSSERRNRVGRRCHRAARGAGEGRGGTPGSATPGQGAGAAVLDRAECREIVVVPLGASCRAARAERTEGAAMRALHNGCGSLSPLANEDL